MKDYYKVLGIPQNASATQIKQAYRNLIKACHPDVNHSQKAAEWTRELNEAYSILSDEESKSSYDYELKNEDSKRTEPPKQNTASQTRSENRTPPKAEPNFCCEKCSRIDPSLRVSATLRVFSFINYARKTPTVKIHCIRCRVKESLAANIYTAILGWWSFWGFFWTLEALLYNAVGGKQPKENNAGLLNAIGYQLYKSGRYNDAYKALRTSFRLKRDSKVNDFLNHLRPQTIAEQKKGFWSRYRSLETHPIFYHVPTAMIGFVILILIFHAMTSGSATTSNQSSNYTPPPVRPLSRRLPVFEPPKADEIISETPVFNEPELAVPSTGGLEFSYNLKVYKGTTAPLKISTRASDGNYLMKVVDWNNGDFVGAYFINSGNILSIELPLGSYKLKFASGNRWYGMKHLFGPSTSYSYIPNKMIFYFDGTYANGHEIQLIPQIGGNLKTSIMKAEEW